MHTILITGATRGIGFEFARQYLSDGWRVIATFRNERGLVQLKALSAEIESHYLELSDRQSVEELALQLTSRPIDLLLCNAAVLGPQDSPFGKTDFAGWEAVMRINLLGQIAIIERLLPNVICSNLKQIAVVSSHLASNALCTGGRIVYRSSKAALNSAVRALSYELTSRGVTTVLLNPGWVRTDMGGPDATLSPTESVDCLKRILSRVRPSDNGSFIDVSGEPLPW